MLRQLAGTAFTLLLFFILLFAYTKVGGPLPLTINSVTTNKNSTFDVTGEGKASVKPDQAKVAAGVTAQGKTVQEVQDQMNKLSNQVTAAVKGVGISADDIQTAQYSVNPNYDYSGGSQKQNGFTASTNLTITVKDINKVNAVIDAATSAGATNVNNLGFNNKDNTAAMDEARAKAVADAKKKAEQISKTAGFNLGKIVNYYEGGGNGPYPPTISARPAMDLKAVSNQTQIEPGTNEVTVTVTLSYEVR